MKPILLIALLSTTALAQPSVSHARLLPDTWANRASFYVGVRSGLAVPPGATSLAPNLSLEMGVAPSRGFGIGMRAMWMNQPPGVPFLGLNPGAYGFGAMADLRVYFETIEPLTIYPTLAIGFLAGPDAVTGRNLVLPVFNPGLGAKLRFGSFYAGFEFGLSGFTIPFMALTLGFQGDSKAEKQRARLAESGLLVEEEGAVLVAPPRPPAPQPQRAKDPANADPFES